MDIQRLSNMELKEELLRHGVKPGPILPSTRGVYEKKLRHLLEIKVQENGDAHEDQYSDSDDEGAQFKGPVGLEVNGDRGNGVLFDNYIQTNVPACIAAEFNQTIATLGDDFSVAKMLKKESSVLKMERRSSVGSTSENKNDGKNRALKNQSEDATSDDISELLSQSALGMSATRRKPIKGAAGRPIQFQYDDIVKRAKMKEQAKETLEEKKPQCLVSVPLQIAIFVLVAFVVLVFFSMESSPENPFEPPAEEQTNLQQP